MLRALLLHTYKSLIFRVYSKSILKIKKAAVSTTAKKSLQKLMTKTLIIHHLPEPKFAVGVCGCQCSL